MPKAPRQYEQETVPQEFAAVPPREPSSGSMDYHFMLLEIGKIGTKVDRLIEDVKGQGEKIDDLRRQATFIKGGIYVAIVAVGVVGWLLKLLMDSRMQAVLSALSTHGSK